MFQFERCDHYVQQVKLSNIFMGNRISAQWSYVCSYECPPTPSCPPPPSPLTKTVLSVNLFRVWAMALVLGELVDWRKQDRCYSLGGGQMRGASHEQIKIIRTHSHTNIYTYVYYMTLQFTRDMNIFYLVSNTENNPSVSFSHICDLQDICHMIHYNLARHIIGNTISEVGRLLGFVYSLKIV